ncbi:DUF6461 domain-containing protein [Herbidospora cretacea]|uniref:DUF6461 domain-containing protein n=1 Tax=Herbidospora cretacea TaxID=28444 RepID=UPI0004C41F46|nr:DUF6461 domain-containing protein [Herbidospora cretacea]
MSGVSHYLDLLEEKWSLAEWGTITWISGMEAADALTILGGDPRSERRLTFDDAHTSASHDFDTRGAMCGEILLDRVGSWLICMEPLGDEGSVAETLLALSKGGTALSLLLHPMSAHTFGYAAGGAALMTLTWLEDPVVSGPMTTGEIIGDVPLLDPELNSDHWQAHALTLAERITGFRLTAEWLGEEHPCYRNSRPTLTY